MLHALSTLRSSISAAMAIQLTFGSGGGGVLQTPVNSWHSQLVNSERPFLPCTAYQWPDSEELLNDD